MSGKKKTTFAKMARESKLRERRMLKQAKKDARKQAGGLSTLEAENPMGDSYGTLEPGEDPMGDSYETLEPGENPTGDSYDTEPGHTPGSDQGVGSA